MSKMIVMIAICCFAMASLSAAQDVQRLRVVPLEQGERAPHAGMLVLDDDLYQLQSNGRFLTLELAQARRLHEELLASQSRIDAAREVAAAATVALHDELWRDRLAERDRMLATAQRAATREWWESPVLWGLLGAAVSAGIAIALALAFGR